MSLLVLALSVILGVRDRAITPADRATQPALGQSHGIEPAAGGLVAGPVTQAVVGRGYDVDATGFGPSTEVDLELTNSQWQGSTRADAAGRVAVHFVVPANLAAGSYVLSLTGRRADAADPTGDVGAVAAGAMPDRTDSRLRVEIFRFTVV